MTYDSSRVMDARIPVSVVELYLDDCAESFGVAPCTASGAAGTECYDTFPSCQDVANFNKVQKTYRFYQPVSNWPVGETGFPCMIGQPSFTPCEIDPRGSLGKRGVVTITLQDFADDDIFTDPYVSTRTYDPETQGTFFRKLKARSRYYKKRFMKVRQGYINNPFSFNDFEDRLYVIESIDIDSSGKVTLKGKDILKFADDKKSVAPEISTGTLASEYTAGGTTLVLQTGEGTDYDTDPYTGSAISVSLPGYVRSGDNVLKFTGVSTDTLTGVVGGQQGSVDENLEIGDSVQLCLNFNTVNVVDVIHYLLKTGAGIDEVYLPYDAGLTTPTGTDDEWDLQKDVWLSANDLSRTVTEPTGINKLLKRICQQNLTYIWWHDRDHEIKLKAIAPPINNVVPPTWNDTSSVMMDSMKTKDNDEHRISQVWIHYDIRDITDDLEKTENYSKHEVIIAADSEGVNAFDGKEILTIHGDWLSNANVGLIITLAGRLLSKYSGAPKLVELEVDAKDADIWLGDSVLLDTFELEGLSGANEVHEIQVLKVKDNHDKQRIKVWAEGVVYGFKKFGYIAPNGTGDYTAETEENQNRYCYISQNDGLYTNGDIGHLIA